MNDLIVWPQPDGKFTVTGETGLHALALFRTDREELQHEAAAYTTQPNVIASINDGDLDQADIFPNYKLVNSHPKIADVISIPFMAVVSLGFTPNALWDNTAEAYFGVTSGSLSEKGEMLMRILGDAYGCEPIFITCLDS